MGQILVGTQGAVADAQPEHRNLAQCIAVVGVFVAAGHLKNPLRQQIIHGMFDVGRMLAILDGGCDSVNQADLVFCLTQQDGAKIAG